MTVTNDERTLKDFLDDLLPERKDGELARLKDVVIAICKDDRLPPLERLDKTVSLLQANGASDGISQRVFEALVGFGLLPAPRGEEKSNQPIKEPSGPDQGATGGPRPTGSAGHPGGKPRHSTVVEILDDLRFQAPTVPVLQELVGRILGLCDDEPLSRADFTDRLASLFPKAPPDFLDAVATALESHGLIALLRQPTEQQATPPDKGQAASSPKGTSTPEKASVASVSEATSTPVKTYPPQPKSGTAFGAGASLSLPEMAITLARGLVLQAWVRPEALVNGAAIVELGDPSGRALIALLTTADGRLELLWHDVQKNEVRATTSAVLTAGTWSHVTVAIDAGSVRFFCGDTEVTRNLSVQFSPPRSASRAANFIGASADPDRPRFTGAIADVRLWNRCDALPAILARSKSSLRGDEVGLCGWWTLEGSSGIQDGSPFGRHARRVGGFKAGPSTFDLAPLPGPSVLDFREGKGAVRLSEVNLTTGGLTWEANVLVRSTGRMKLFSLKTPIITAELTLERGKLSFTATNAVLARNGNAIIGAGAIQEDKWMNVAVTWSPTGQVRLLVNSKIVGSGATATPFPGEYSGTLAEDLDGQMAEVRLWSRVLTPGEQYDLSKRRIHGWAPGLVGCWRMDDAVTKGDLGNAVLGRASAAIVGKGVTAADPGRLAIAPAPKLSLPRAARLLAGESLKLPSMPMSDVRAAGLSVQLWVRPETLSEATLLVLPAQSADGSALTLTLSGKGGIEVLKVARDDDDKVANTRKDDKNRKTQGGVEAKATEFLASITKTANEIAARVDRSMTASSVYRKQRWSHVTVTLDADGVACVYRNGQLLARELLGRFKVASFTSGTIGSPQFAGMVSELRVWSRALSSREVAANWDRRVKGAAGLSGRWALGTDLSGTPGAAKGPARLYEAGSLAIQDGPAAARATVDVCCSLLADQRGSGGKPQIVVDLTALDATGRAQSGVNLSLVLDQALVLYRSTVHPSRRLRSTNPGDTNYTVKTDRQGRARVVFEPSQLSAPLLRIRHESMDPGEWVVTAPDVVIQQLLVSLSADELRDGPRATASTRAKGKGLVAEGYTELAKVLRGMAQTAAQFSLEMQEEGALAFGGDEEAPTSTPLQPVQGANFCLPEGGTLVRRVVRRAAGDAPALPESFSAFDWITDTFEAVVEFGEDLIEDGVDAVENVVDGIITSIKLGVDTVIDGIKIAAEWVIETVEDIAAAITDVFNRIKKSVAEVLAFMAALFDWGDICETAEFTLATLKSTLKSTKSGMQRVFDTAEAEVRSAQTTILAALNKTPSITAAAKAETAQGSLDTLQLTGPLDLLIGMLPDDLESAVKPVLDLFDPIADALAGALAKISTLATGLDKEWQSGELQKALAKPERFLDTDPGEWLSLARMLVAAVANSVVLTLDIVSDLLAAVLDVIGKILDLRIDIPMLTDFVEAHVLDGKQLTVGRLLCMVTAIPTTLAYKLVMGNSESLCAQLNGPASFGDPTEEDAGERVADIVMRSVHLTLAVFLDTLDGIETLAKETKQIKVTHAVGIALSGACALADAYFVFADPFRDNGWKKSSDLAKAGTVIDMAAWVLGAGALVVDTVALSTNNDGVGMAAAVLGAASSAAGVVSGVVDCVDTFMDDGHTAGQGTVAVLDTVSSLAEFAAGVASAVPAEDGVGRIVRASVVISGHAIELSTGLASLVVRSTTEQGA